MNNHAIKRIRCETTVKYFIGKLICFFDVEFKYDEEARKTDVEDGA